MAIEFEFLSPTDKPALLALSTPEFLAHSRAALSELEYKVHVASNHEDFTARFSQIHYQVVILEERFAADQPADNLTLNQVQWMPMPQRRHAVFFLIGLSFRTMTPLQAYQQSVHAVINPADIASLKQIIQQTVADNQLFLNAYRDTQTRIAQGKA
jgi:hypothetical protein